MLLNYIKIALRNLLRHKRSTIINIFGLSVGIAAAILIFLYARHELQYDAFHENGRRISIVAKERTTVLGTRVLLDTWVPLAGEMRQDYPGIAAAVRMFDRENWVTRGDKKFRQTVMYADSNMLQVFSFPLQKGDAATALKDPGGIVISPAVAQRFFGDGDPMGKTLTVSFDSDYTVKGVLADIPTNSSIQMDIVAPFESAVSPDDERANSNWRGSFLSTYVMLAPQADRAAMETGLVKLVDRIWGAEGPNGTQNHRLRLLPLNDLYDFNTGARQYAYILLGIAAIILLIAAINFMNLSTARSLDRAREIGLRKVVGALRSQLILQFLGEALVMSGLALVAGLFLAELLLPLFNRLFEMQLGIDYLANGEALLGLVLLGAVVGLLAGSYPALVLSGFEPIQSLKGRFAHTAGGVRLRNLLVIIQFTLSVALIIGTLVVWQQIRFMKNQHLNFRTENILVLPTAATDFADHVAAKRSLAVFARTLRETAGIESVGASSSVPGRYENWNMFARPQDWEAESPLRVRVAVVDEDYFDVYRMTFIEGRNFSREFATDSTAGIIINESAMHAMGWESAVGKTVNDDFTVIGVVADFHWESLQQEVGPIVHFFRPLGHRNHNYLSVSLSGGNTAALLAAVGDHWRQLDGQRAFEYYFIDEAFNRLYAAEERMGTVTSFFSLLAIIIASLGLFALASFSAVRRTREIGIRKTLGASLPGLIFIFSKSFLAMVMLAILIASPLAYWLMESWLAGYPYRTAIGADVFLTAAGVALLIAALTIAYQTMRTASVNPAAALRYE